MFRRFRRTREDRQSTLYEGSPKLADQTVTSDLARGLSDNDYALGLIRQIECPGRIIVDWPTTEFEARAVNAHKYQQQPFRPDAVLDGWATDQLCVRACSTRGDAHRADGTPRQDDFVLAHHQRTGSLVAVIGDGVSQASESHLGASTACRYGANAIVESLNRGQHPDWMNVLRGSAWALVELAQRRMRHDADAYLAEKLYATTLTAVLVEPVSASIYRISGVTVGDPAVWILRDGQLLHLAGGKAAGTDEPFTAEVVALPRLPDLPGVFQDELSPGDVLLVMSDGIGDPLGDGSGLVGSLLKSQLISPPNMLQFGRVTDFSRETFTDDRTLVGVWPFRRSK